MMVLILLIYDVAIPLQVFTSTSAVSNNIDEAKT